MAIETSILEDRRVVELLKEFKEDPSIKVLMTPIKAMLKAKESLYVELEFVALQLILDIKKGKTTNFRAALDLDIKELKAKLSKLINKTVIANAVEAAELLLKNQDLEGDMPAAVNSIREGFVDLREDTKIKATKEDKLSSTDSGTYDNPNFREVLVQFEANESIVYLMNLVNRAYAEELFLLRANRIVAALEIITSIREEGENPLIYFGKMNLAEIRRRMRGSVSLEIIDICLGSASALFERVGDVEGATASLKNALKNLKSRLSAVKQKIQES